MTTPQLYTTVALCIYTAIMIFIGCISYGKSKTLDGFLIGGRNIGAWATAFAYGTTYFSAVVFVGYAGQHGWNIGIGAIWIGVGNAVLGCLLSWLLFANRTRKMTKKLNARTMADFFEKRYDSKGMKLLAAVIIFVFLVPYSAAVYKGLGSLFSVVFPGVQTWVWMLAIAVLTAVYLVAGGYIATSYTDLIQGIIMIVGVILLIVAVLRHEAVGGLKGLIENLSKFQSLPEDPNPVTGSQLTSIIGGTSFRFLCFNIMLTSFGTWGLPQMIGKFYAIKDTAAIKRGTVISTFFCAVIGCGAYLIGSTSRLILGGQLPDGGIDGVIPAVLMEVLGGGKLGLVLLAIIMVLLLSASMSTLQSVVLTDGEEMLLTPTYHVFRLFREHHNNTLLGSFITNPAGEKGRAPQLMESASVDSDGRIISTVVNTSAEESAEIECQIADFKVGGITAEILTGELGAYNTFEAKDTVCTAVFNGFEPTADGFKATLPPCSVVRFVIR